MAKKETKKETRERIKQKFDGKCAYCGEKLGQRWHADHFQAVEREWWTKEKKPMKPENENFDNMYPSCAPCNLEKHIYPIERFRNILENKIKVLNETSTAYRHAKRYGLIKETNINVVFWFEKYNSKK